MTKTWKIISVVAFLSITIGILFWYTEVDINSSFYYFDNENDSFYILNTDKNANAEILSTNKEGEIYFSQELPSKLNESEVYYSEIIENNNEIYALGVTKYDSEYIKEDIFIVLNSKGKYKEHYIIEEYEDTTRTLENISISDLIKKDNTIYFAHQNEYLTIYEYNKERKEPIIFKKLNIDKKVDYNNVILTNDLNIYLNNSNGHIYSVSKYGLIEQLDLADSKKSVPVQIVGGDYKNILFYDAYNYTYIKYNGNKIKEISEEEYMKETHAISLPNNFKHSIGTYITYGLIIGMIVLTIMIIIGFIINYSIKSFGGITPLLIKQLVIVIPIIAICMTLMYFKIRNSYEEDLKKEEMALLYSVAEKTSNTINGDVLASINLPEEYGSNKYNLIKNQKQPIFETNKVDELENFNRTIYTELYFTRNNRHFLAINSIGLQCGAPIDYYVNSSTYKEFDKVYQNNLVSTGVTQDGNWLYVLVPVTNSNGENVGVLETGISVKEYKKIAKEGVAKILIISLVAAIIIISIISIVVTILLKPIKELKKSVNEVAAGDFSNKVEIESKDELGEIGRAFNKMSDKVSKYINELEVINKAYERFIPSEFIKMLDKDSVLDINKGDYSVKELQVMYIDIKNYSQIMENKNYDMEFNLLNKIYELCADEILKINGVIQEYTERGLIAIFSGRTDELLSACLKINEKIKAFEKENKLVNIDLKITLDKGSIMLGIAGQEERISTVIISDIINRLKYISLISENYGMNISITNAIYSSLETINSFNMRLAGIIKSEHEDIIIYDIIYCDDPYIASIKNITKKDFEQGVKKLINGNFHEARKYFINVIKNDDSDKMAKQYILLCEKYISEYKEIKKGYIVL